MGVPAIPHDDEPFNTFYVTENSQGYYDLSMFTGSSLDSGLASTKVALDEISNVIKASINPGSVSRTRAFYYYKGDGEFGLRISGAEGYGQFVGTNPSDDIDDACLAFVKPDSRHTPNSGHCSVHIPAQ